MYQIAHERERWKDEVTWKKVSSYVQHGTYSKVRTEKRLRVTDAKYVLPVQWHSG